MKTKVSKYKYDVFISYSHKDKEWVQNWLLPEMDKAGLQVCIDFRDFEIGLPSITNIERAIENSNRIIFVLTPSWVKSEWTNLEAILIQSDDPIGLRGRMLPLMLNKCEIPKRLNILTYADFTKSAFWNTELNRILRTIGKKGWLPSTAEDIPAFQAFFAHPYLMPKNWTGRLEEIKRLDNWVNDKDFQMCCLVAIGGMGKSSMAWKWIQDSVLQKQNEFNLDGIFQWSFYEGDLNFYSFLEEFRKYLNLPADADSISVISHYLNRKRILLILDGFERLLTTYATVEAAYLPDRIPTELKSGERSCYDWTIARFLRSLLAITKSKILLISRLIPEEIDERAGWMKIELKGLDPIDAIAFMRKSGIRGSDNEIIDMTSVYDFHPLSLSKLVNILHYNINQPNEIREALNHDITLDVKARRQHILKRAYETLPEELGNFLSSLAATRNKPNVSVAQHILENKSNEMLSKSLKRLEEDEWLTWDRNNKTIELHPLVRRYAYERLNGKLSIHEKLISYYLPFAKKVDSQNAETITQLAPIIELYFHTVRSHSYDKAYNILHKNLDPYPLYYTFGAYTLCQDLMLELFPDRDDKNVPPLTSPKEFTTLMSDLALVYRQLGKAKAARSLLRRIPDLMDERENTRLRVKVLRLQSSCEINLGNLKAAEEYLLQRIALCEKINNEEFRFRSAVARRRLGLVFGLKGEIKSALDEIDLAIDYFKNCPEASPKTGIDNKPKRNEARSWLEKAHIRGIEGNGDKILYCIQKARELMKEKVTEDDVIASWLAGSAYLILKKLKEAEDELKYALNVCRATRFVEVEVDILISLVKLYYYQNKTKDFNVFLNLMSEALELSERCDYRLKKADCHFLLSEIAIEIGEREKAKHHAEIALRLASFDDTKYNYGPIVDKTEKILREINIFDS